MEKNNIDTKKIKELISKGMDLSFKKLLKQKQERNGVFAFTVNGRIKKIKALDID